MAEITQITKFDALRDRAPRESVYLAVTIVEKQSGRSFEARMRNLSATGALLEYEGAVRLSGEISVTFRGVADMSANVVRTDGQQLGIHFDREIEPSLCHRSMFGQTSKRQGWLPEVAELYKRSH